MIEIWAAKPRVNRPGTWVSLPRGWSWCPGRGRSASGPVRTSGSGRDEWVWSGRVVWSGQVAVPFDVVLAAAQHREQGVPDRESVAGVEGDQRNVVVHGQGPADVGQVVGERPVEPVDRDH